MSLKRYLLLCTISILMGFLAIGCGQKDLDKTLGQHNAMKMYEEGDWEPRYVSTEQLMAGEGISLTRTTLSVNANKELSKEEMMDIMDYYKVKENADFDQDGQYRGERCTDYACYAIFYQGSTDNELLRVKCLNGKEAETADGDNSLFPLPSYESERGDMP